MRFVAVSTVLRALVVVITLGVVGMGAWSKFIIHDIEVRGFVILNLADLESTDEDAKWRSFFRTAIGGQTRIWIAIAAGCFTSLSALLILLSHTVHRMRFTPAVALPLEVLSTLSISTAFTATLSLAITFPASLNTVSSPDLVSFAMLLSLTRVYAISSGAGVLFLVATTTYSIVQIIRRARDSKLCSFEPTANALGMSHGYQVPTMHDSRTATPVQEGKGFAGAGAAMGRSDSGESRVEKVHLRPHRPWSEMSRR